MRTLLGRGLVQSRLVRRGVRVRLGAANRRGDMRLGRVSHRVCLSAWRHE
jgi:hypothetical protein